MAIFLVVKELTVQGKDMVNKHLIITESDNHQIVAVYAAIAHIKVS